MHTILAIFYGVRILLPEVNHKILLTQCSNQKTYDKKKKKKPQNSYFRIFFYLRISKLNFN